MSEAPDWTQEPGVQEAFAEADARAAFDPEAFAAAVAEVTAAAEQLSATGRGLSVLPWTDAATMWHALDAATRSLRQTAAILATHAAKQMADAGIKQAPVEGVGVVEWRRGQNRVRWDSEGAIAAALDRKLDTLEGEIPDPWSVRDWLLDVAHVDYCRVGKLRELGIDAKDFRSSEPGLLSISVV